MPASCITRWWTILRALQFLRDYYDDIYDVLYNLKKLKKKYLPNCKEQNFISVICKIFEPLKTLGEHMNVEKVVTASSIWPIYSKLEGSLLHTNFSKYTCHLSLKESNSRNDVQDLGDSEQLFSIQSQCTLVEDIMTSCFNNDEVHEGNSDDDNHDQEDTCNTIDNLLEHIENNLKQEIKKPFQKRYITDDSHHTFLQKTVS